MSCIFNLCLFERDAPSTRTPITIRKRHATPVTIRKRRTELAVLALTPRHDNPRFCYSKTMRAARRHLPAEKEVAMSRSLFGRNRALLRRNRAVSRVIYSPFSAYSSFPATPL